ncbi:hypothetical protein [Streptomyces naphthomycinicus]|uniref:hypothetical protein n=1 Tax=Streptomyces naphthomycinicus TaxID=2872625 RepID=UPI001CED5EC2|nr:hypothetical protein [Streptomyces sp. TML10]
MFNMKKIAAVSGLVGGLAAACAGIAQAQVGPDPRACARDLMGNISCSQHIEGRIPEGGTIPHQESCVPVQPVTVPAALGDGRVRLGPEVTCSPSTQGVPMDDVTQGVPIEADEDRGPSGLPR